MRNVSMNSGLSAPMGKGGSIYAGNLLFGGTGLKSTQEKAERQQKAAGEMQFWEKQKENLKERECETVEEIAKKLEALHTYEDQIKAVKMAYNHEQMMHMMDEAKEMGEKIAKAAEKMEAKTPEERREDAVEEAQEAMGGEEDTGMLTEVLEEFEDLTEELEEELEEELAEQGEEIAEAITEELQEGAASGSAVEEAPKDLDELEKLLLEEKMKEKKAAERMPFDVRI